MATYDELRDRTIVITGGANGIGEAIVRAFHAQQAIVYFCDTDSAAGNSLARDLGERVSFTRVDLTPRGSDRALVEAHHKGRTPDSRAGQQCGTRFAHEITRHVRAGSGQHLCLQFAGLFPDRRNGAVSRQRRRRHCQSWFHHVSYRPRAARRVCRHQGRRDGFHPLAGANLARAAFA